MLCSAADDIIGIWFGCFPSILEPHEYTEAKMKKNTNEDAGSTKASGTLMFVAPKMLWNNWGKISAMSNNTACCMLNRTNRGNCGFLDPVDKPIKTMKPPKGIAFSSATNGAKGSNGKAISGKSLITYWPKGIASDIGRRYGRHARAFEASSTSSSVTGCFFFSDSSPLKRLKLGSEK